MAIKFKRRFLSVAELLQRWQCSEVDLKNEVIEGMLRPSVFVRDPADFVTREGGTVFFPDDSYIKPGAIVDELFGPEFLHRGFVVLRHPIRDGTDTCSFYSFSNAADYENQGDPSVIGMLEGGIPLETYWTQMVFDMPSVLKFEVDRTEGEGHNVGADFDRPVSTRERNTLLTIIAVLAKAAKVPLDDYSRPGKAAGYIEGLTDDFGTHVSKRAIEEHLKKIPDALETRMK